MNFLIKVFLIAFLCAGALKASARGTGSGSFNLIPSYSDLLRMDPNFFDNLDSGQSRTPRIKKRSEYPQSWIVATFDGDAISNAELEKFIENSKMTDSRKIQLFREAGKDYDKYLELKYDWIYSWWRPSLKQLLYYKMLEKEAVREGRDRKAFKTTRSEYWDATDKAENDIIKSLLDEGRGIVYAREKYAEFLREQDYPHRAGESSDDTYFRWRNSLYSRIKEQLRIREVKKMEFLNAHPKADPNYSRPMGAVYDLNQQARQKAAEIFSREDLNDDIIGRELNENPLVLTVIKKITPVSLKETSLKKYHEINSAKLEQAHGQFLQQTGQIMGQDLLDNMGRYEETAAKLAAKYQDVARLEELSENSLERFMQSDQGDYRNLVLSKLYKLASSILRDSPNRELIRSQAVAQLADSFVGMERSLADLDAIVRDNDAVLTLPDYLAKKLSDDLGISGQATDYKTRLLNLGIWMAKFEAKRIALQDPAYYHVEYREYRNFEGQRYLEEFWLEREFDRKLESYRQRTLKRRNRWSVQINPEGGHRWSSEDSIQFIFE